MKRKKSYRTYPDTSVFGGTGDERFTTASLSFFELVQRGDFTLVLSALVEDEIDNAPDAVRVIFQELKSCSEWVEIGEEAMDLRDAYIEAGVLTDRWSADALHVALATVAECDLIVSWNFRHIVHFQKVPLYHAVSRLHGYREVGIYTPQEVLKYDR
ncbi:MAG TPA: type II toxin-antitoxin system VapC family toxin [Candidatus Brocadiia bacterium]|nr:type II toxin-antitoxin system VapC family toxin [Candidatus Brocadiia bacterium]